MLERRLFLAGAFLFVLLTVPCCSSSELSQDQTGTPATVPREVHNACDAAHAIAATIPGVSIQRTTGTFQDEVLQEPVAGCRLAISGSFAAAEAEGDPTGPLRRGFTEQAWQDVTAYGADGKDGTAFGLRKAAVLCLFRGEWNGGSDGEPEVPREDWYRIAVMCTGSAPAPEPVR